MKIAIFGSANLSRPKKFQKVENSLFSIVVKNSQFFVNDAMLQRSIFSIKPVLRRVTVSAWEWGLYKN
jgi:hypothetical protein